MTPLYDVISAQPSVDANQIRRNQFRLAMAVGDNRHYIIRTVASRHFIQTANRAGIGEEVVASIFDELRGTAEAAIDREAAKLPKNFPEEVAGSIISGMKGRLRAI
jgi:serine/threonine-protein kinase HipA